MAWWWLQQKLIPISRRVKTDGHHVEWEGLKRAAMLVATKRAWTEAKGMVYGRREPDRLAPGGFPNDRHFRSILGEIEAIL